MRVLLSLVVFLVVSLVFSGSGICAGKAPHPTRANLPDSATYSVVKVNGEWQVRQGVRDSTAFCYANFNMNQNITGWAELNITSNGFYSDFDQAWCAGYVEGRLTSEMISQHWESVYWEAFLVNQTYLDTMKDVWLPKHLTWLNGMINKNAATSLYWHHVNLTLTQLQGMVDGIAEVGGDVDFATLYLLNAKEEVGDILPTLFSDLVPEWSSMQDEDAFLQANRNAHCSVIVKILPDLSDLYCGHNTWTSYAYMLRIFKSYTLHLSGVAAAQVIFSSYPGCLSSVDDYYINNNSMVIMETTNNFYNSSLYSFIGPQAVLTWVRAYITNRLADSGPVWAETFSEYNSGTYNNQWIVVDYKQFTPYQALQPDTLWILEQIPGYIRSADMTQTLGFGYWPSYNVAYFSDINEISGFPAMSETHGTFWNYDLAPRAMIFRRDGWNVSSVAGYQWEMQYNNYENDPFSDGNPINQIASRADLLPINITSGLGPVLFGAIDAKFVNNEMVRGTPISSWAISGPTHTQQPIFSYFSTQQPVSQPWLGQPETFDFDWMVMEFESCDSATC